MAAAESLRASLVGQLRDAPAGEVYARQAEALRAALLGQLELTPGDGVNALLAASGTDLHLLVTQWLRPDCTVMIAPVETGSGVAHAVQGLHFNTRTAAGRQVLIGAPVSRWRGALHTLAARTPEGALRAPESIDADCIAHVERAASAGLRVLLVLTDVSKTGLIVPSIATVLSLKRRWPGQVEVLVDACQWRLSNATVRAYLANDCMLALTGSKFVAGPTFCAALLLPPALSARYREQAVDPAAQAYSQQADWPDAWAAARALAPGSNFGLLLRWAAARAQLDALAALAPASITAHLAAFGQALAARCERDAHFVALAQAPLCRAALGCGPGWDAQASIFPFLVLDAHGQPLRQPQTAQLYRQLRSGGGDGKARRFELGQPVACGMRDGVPVSALRLCVSAPMLAGAARAGGPQQMIADAQGALDQIVVLLGSV